METESKQLIEQLINNTEPSPYDEKVTRKLIEHFVATDEELSMDYALIEVFSECLAEGKRILADDNQRADLHRALTKIRGILPGDFDYDKLLLAIWNKK